MMEVNQQTNNAIKHQGAKINVCSGTEGSSRKESVLLGEFVD